MYKIKVGETIRDVCLNACGSINAWNDILELNGYTDWVPELKAGQELEVPAIIDANIQRIQQTHLANNATDSNVLSSSIVNIEYILNNAILYDYTPNNIVKSFINYYVVRGGETIKDVVINATGTIDNWDVILTANDFTDWVPSLIVGQKIIIP